MKLPVRRLGRLVGALLLCVEGLAFASPHYLYSFLGGDEIVPTDLNDHGVVVPTPVLAIRPIRDYELPDLGSMRFLVTGSTMYEL